MTPKPTVTYDGITYKVRSHNTEIPDLDSMERIETTSRIRWHDEQPGTSLACKGYVGTHGGAVFKIYRPDDKCRNWMGAFQLAISDDRYFHGGTLADAKEQAERWLERFVSYLGAPFPETPDARWSALKDYLTRQIERDIAAAEGFRSTGDTGAGAAHYALVSANRSTLAKMRELEAGR